MKEKRKVISHEEEKLPWDLMEEILSRVPPKSLVRFRAVSKPWNNLFNDKRFIHNHKTTFHFVLATKSKIYSVNVANPNKIVVSELPLDIPGLDKSKKLIDFNEFLLCRINRGASVWNPWLRQSKWIEPCLKESYMKFSGIGYDNNRSYKIIGYCTPRLWKIYDFASDAWKDYECGGGTGNTEDGQKHNKFFQSRVSLNGTLYWVVSSGEMNEEFLFIKCFDFSKEKFFDFCDLPCGKNHPRDAIVLGVFKGEQFSLFKQCYATKKIEIFVTKDKITSSNCDDVVWMSFMQVSIPNFPDLVQKRSHSHSQPSYFIDNDKRLIVCSCDKTGRAWIYIVWENKLISKIQLDSVVGHKPLHCTYNPSLVMVPSIQPEDIQLQV